MKKTIKFTAKAEPKEFLTIAKELGYEEKIFEPQIEIVDETIAGKNALRILEKLDNGKVKVQTGIIEKNNPQTPEEFIALYFQGMIDGILIPILEKIHTEEIRKKREEEDKQIKKQVEAKIKETTGFEIQ